jgi:hypothetical protein
MSWEDFEMSSSSQVVTPSQAKQAVLLARAVPYYMYPFWAVGYFGVAAIKHFNWRK